MTGKPTRPLILLATVFGVIYFLPVNNPVFGGAVLEALAMAREYAREHVLTCLAPAFFIAGAIMVFISQGAVLNYLGGRARKILAYAVASVSGTILAVCSCTVLPLFAGIYTRGAGLGPATAFLYSGPAINILAIVLTAKVLGWKLGLARGIGAVLFSVVIGLLMEATFSKEEAARQRELAIAVDPDPGRPLWQNALLMAAMVGILVFGAWGQPREAVGWAMAVFSVKWYLAAGFLALTVVLAARWIPTRETKEWFSATGNFAVQILPLLLAGVLVAGFLLGRPTGGRGVIPSSWVGHLVGGNSLAANLFASLSGALMYFATLTEVPILQGLLGSGMGSGPALALLLAGPALSLPNMLVIRKILGTKKTLAYIAYVVLMATITGLLFGILVPAVAIG